MLDFICIRNAREHNLQGIDLDLPKNKLIVITGVSGSGKSSLAFDTIYAEGQRRYVESLSAYARQFLDLQSKPDVESITGLSPAISINQRSTSKNPRSTVSTVTEIYDYLRLMYARIGIPYSPVTDKPITKSSVSQIVDNVLSLPIGTRIYILGVLVRGRKGEHQKEIYDVKRKGYSRLKIDGHIYDINNLPILDKNRKHDIFVVVDRVIVSEESDNRLPSSIETALQIGNGVIHIEIVSLPDDYQAHDYKNNQVLVFSENFACPESGFTIEEIEPRLFSFNTPHGSCSECNGLGKSFSIDVNLVIPNQKLSIESGAIDPIGPLSNDVISRKSLSNFSYHYGNVILSLAQHYNVNLTTPWSELNQEFKDIVLFGSNENSAGQVHFRGLVNILSADDEIVIEKIAEKYYAVNLCNKCRGYRLKPEALSIKINNKNIGELVKMSVNEAIVWMQNLSENLSEQHRQISNKLISEVVRRLMFLKNVGLDYLTLDRESGTLSGGESQRIRLASQIGSGLTGVLYVLDEPSIGLHQCDNDLLISTLKNLRDIGNTVIVVEHDEDTIKNADYIVDIGPGAGQKGGLLIAQGTAEQIMDNPASITGQYLSEKKMIPIPKRRELSGNWINIIDACENNLQNVSVKFPVGKFICVTGVSGGGKSSLVIETLYKYTANKLCATHESYGKCKNILGLEYIDKVIEIDQSPIGRTPLSNPATYVGLFTHIRTWFAGLQESKMRGYNIGRFSFNAKGGRCEACRGDGHVKIEMHFLPDIYVKCDQCKGLRYNRETLEVTYKGKSIADVLEMTVNQAVEFFANLPLIREKLVSLRDVGMGYIKIGQPSNTLSGGEAQRIKLSKELSKRSTGRTLYILDEPTTGLHFEDINNLLKVLHQLVELGNTVIIIEHNLHVIKTADYIVDIGPGGGVRGGKVVAYGTPEEIVKIPESITGKYLKSYLSY